MVKRVGAALREAPHSTRVSVTRARRDLLPAFAAEYGARRFHAEWKDLVRDNEMDAVYIATPVALHAEQAIAAAEAGKHVLCEKPVALAVEDCARMVAAARHNNVLSASIYLD